MNILINGGSRGLGKEVVKILSENEKNIILVTGRNEDSLKALSEAGKYGNIIPFKLDISAFESYENTFIDIVDRELKSIDILINMAGLLIVKDFADFSSGDSLKIMQTNFLGPSALIRAVKPYLKKGSHIINISSMGAYQGSAKYKGLSYYSASKAALSCLSECLAVEFREDGIIVNCLALGSADTGMFREAFPGYEAGVTAEEMAEFIADFTVNGSRFFNGKVLPVALNNP
ncbi:MAG TPA: SDR family oxidoreductase [Bacteroidales bacterium]|jgi:NAD(P)-dependent dehydrogenase (short-subunit alcohol dehydrogenase family)|nr:SDR family oxidoreductase [Bacteroidales bacterium]